MATVQHACLARRSLRPRLHDLPRERLGIVLAEHARAPQVSMLARAPPPVVSSAARDGGAHPWASSPDRSSRTDGLQSCRFAEIHVGPLQRDHLAAPQSRLTAQQRDEMGSRVESARRFDEPFVLVEVVERASSPSAPAGASPCTACAR